MKCKYKLASNYPDSADLQKDGIAEQDCFCVGFPDCQVDKGVGRVQIFPVPSGRDSYISFRLLSTQCLLESDLLVNQPDNDGHPLPAGMRKARLCNRREQVSSQVDNYRAPDSLELLTKPSQSGLPANACPSLNYSPLDSLKALATHTKLYFSFTDVLEMFVALYSDQAVAPKGQVDHVVAQVK